MIWVCVIRVVGEAAIAAVKKELQDAIQRTGVRPKTVRT